MALVVAFCLNASAQLSYSADFTTGAATDWTTIDNNNSGKTFVSNANMLDTGMSVLEDSFDDYYVSPAFSLVSGVTYTIKARVANPYGVCGGDFTVECGTSATDATTFATVGAVDVATVYSWAEAVAQEFTYTPTTSGTYYFAYHVTGTNGNSLSSYVLDFSVEGTEGSLATGGDDNQGGGDTPGTSDEGGEFTITETFDDDSHFTESTSVPDGWKSEGSYSPFQRSSSYDYGYMPKSGSYSFNSANSTSTSSRDEVFYTPLKNLVAGKECTVSFYVYAPGGTPASAFYSTLTVKAGTAQSMDAQTIEVGSVAQACSDWTEFSFAFTPETEGEYCFSFALGQSATFARDHGVTLVDDVTIKGCSPAASEVPAVETTAIPYTIDFTSTAEGWTALDKSTSGQVTWGYDETGYFYSGYKPAVAIDYGVHNDYWISPAFTLEAGKSYKVVTKSTNMDRGSSVLTLELGTSLTNDSTFSKIATLNPSTTYADYADQPTEENTVTVAQSGVYYIAFHLLTESEYTDKGYDLLYFEIAEDGSYEPEPEPEPIKASLPYSIDFTSANTEWTTLDASGGQTWKFASDGYMASAPAVTVNDESADVDDYYISPQFALEAGKTYTVKTRTSNPWASGTLTLEIGTSLVNKLAYTTVATLTPSGFDSTYDPATVEAETFTLTVEDSGDYFLAFHAVMDKNWVGFSLVGFSIEEEVTETPGVQAAEIPYSIDFTVAANAEWTVLDNNESKDASWAYTTDASGMMNAAYAAVALATDNNQASDDYYISPAFKLSAGNTYDVTLKAFDPNWGASGDVLTLELGTSLTDASTFAPVATIDVDQDHFGDVSGLAAQNCQIKVEQDGEYHIAFHAAQLLGRKGFQLFSFAIEHDTSSVTNIEAVEDIEAVYYNLQGIQVANPEAGEIYIVRRGNTVTKEVKL